MSDADRIVAACKLLGIERVAIAPAGMRREGLPDTMIDSVRGREIYFAPNGDVLGFWTPEEALAKLRCAVSVIENERAGQRPQGIK